MEENSGSHAIKKSIQKDAERLKSTAQQPTPEPPETEIQWSRGQQLFFDHLLRGDNIFLSGKAGTGKTTCAKEGFRMLTNAGKNVAIVAPTGVAANNIKGTTIHSMFQINPFGVATFQSCGFFRAEKRLMMEQIDVIAIDEVSMVRADVLDAINWTLLKNGCRGLDKLQIIFIGDLKQLENVVDDSTRSVLLETYSGIEFYNAKIYQHLKVKTVDLDEVLRQSDPKFINALNMIRDGAASVPYFKKFIRDEPDPESIILAPHNDTVTYYNKKGLNTLTTPTHIFRAEFEGKVNAADYNIDSIIEVKDGASIMYLVNSRERNLVNGSLGIFRARGGMYFIEVDGVQWELQRTKFSKFAYELNPTTRKLELVEKASVIQYPFRLAYALSIHKSQSLSFDRLTVDLRRKCFASGQLYVALSRVRTPEGLTIVVGGRE